MRRLLLFSALLLISNVLSNPGVAQSSATTTLSANPANVTAGESVGFTATVQTDNVSLSPVMPLQDRPARSHSWTEARR